MSNLDDAILIQDTIFKPCGYSYTEPVKEAESAEYNACNFKVNGSRIKFRSAKITPTKTGQFVTLWKRMKNGPIEPLDVNDAFDLIIISCRDADKFGCFIFRKSVLLKNGALAADGKGGKRAIRVYPPWVTTNSSQAEKTQAWQARYFLEILPKGTVNNSSAHKVLIDL